MTEAVKPERKKAFCFDKRDFKCSLRRQLDDVLSKDKLSSSIVSGLRICMPAVFSQRCTILLSLFKILRLRLSYQERNEKVGRLSEAIVEQNLRVSIFAPKERSLRSRYNLFWAFLHLRSTWALKHSLGSIVVPSYFITSVLSTARHLR